MRDWTTREKKKMRKKRKGEREDGLKFNYENLLNIHLLSKRNCTVRTLSFVSWITFSAQNISERKRAGMRYHLRIPVFALPTRLYKILGTGDPTYFWQVHDMSSLIEFIFEYFRDNGSWGLSDRFTVEAWNVYRGDIFFFFSLLSVRWSRINSSDYKRLTDFVHCVVCLLCIAWHATGCHAFSRQKKKKQKKRLFFVILLFSSSFVSSSFSSSSFCESLTLLLLRLWHWVRKHVMRIAVLLLLRSFAYFSLFYSTQQFRTPLVYYR